jgi:hypothetical protein
MSSLSTPRFVGLKVPRSWRREFVKLPAAVSSNVYVTPLYAEITSLVSIVFSPWGETSIKSNADDVREKFVNVTVTLLMLPLSPLTDSPEGFGLPGTPALNEIGVEFVNVAC